MLRVERFDQLGGGGAGGEGELLHQDGLQTTGLEVKLREGVGGRGGGVESDRGVASAEVRSSRQEAAFRGSVESGNWEVGRAGGRGGSKCNGGGSSRVGVEGGMAGRKWLN